MHEFFISRKMAKRLLCWTACTIVVLSVACVFFDKINGDATQVVRLDCQSMREITSEIQKNNIILKDHSLKIGEMNKSITGILGIAKGTLEFSPSFEPSINLPPGRSRKPRKPQKDTLVVVNTVITNDSIAIKIENRDSTVLTSTNEAGHKYSARKKCCCCNCCCNAFRKEDCK